MPIPHSCSHILNHTHTHTHVHTHILHIIFATVQRFVKEERLPHLLFYGPPGTGKTSTILACAKTLYKPREFSSMVLELNASDDRGIGIVRGKILTFASTRTIFRSGFKLIILDEADSMTNDAQNALRRGQSSVISDICIGSSLDSALVVLSSIPQIQMYKVALSLSSPPPSLSLLPLPNVHAVIEKFTDNVRFCLICNYLSKIIPALQSRCTRFRFGPLSSEQMVLRLEYVIQQEW